LSTTTISTEQLADGPYGNDPFTMHAAGRKGFINMLVAQYVNLKHVGKYK